MRKLMTKVALAAAVVTGAAFLQFAPAANAATVPFGFLGGGVDASGTLDVTGGQALDGTGTITSPFWVGPETLTLVTLSTPNVHDLGGGNLSYRFGGGTDLIGDTVYPIDSSGLVFSVTNSNPADPFNLLNVGLNVWSNGDGTFTLFLAGNGIYYGTTAVSTAAPLPGAMFLFGSVLSGAALFLRRRKDQHRVPAA